MKKAIQILTATLATIALAACQPHDEMEQEQGTVTVNEISVQVQQLSSMGGTGTRATTRATDPDVTTTGGTTTRADENGMEGVVKTQFVAGDVIHIMVQIGSSILNVNDPCYTATLNANGRWTLNNPIVLPQNATKTYMIDAFYDGEQTHYEHYGAYQFALSAALSGTTSVGSNLRKYIDLLRAYGGNFYGTGWNDLGIVITSDGKLTIKMAHQHALLRIASITNNLGSPVTGIVANLTVNSDYTLALATTPAIPTATTPVAEAIAKLGSYLKSFTITLENGRQLTVDAPGYNSNPASGTPTGKGTMLYSGMSYTYRLHLNPGSLTAIPTDGSIGDAPGWDNQVDPNVPTGYIGIYDRKGLEAMGNTENLGNPEAKFILMADIDLTPGMPDGSGGTNGEWVPIGTRSNAFTGTFNGNGHTITGMTINASGANNQGLFGYIGGTAILYNIHMREVDVTGGDYTAALVGYANGGTTISGCSSTGTVVGTDGSGGLVGVNMGHIARCWSTAAVTASGSDYYIIGGLVGSNSNDGTIVASYTQGSIVKNNGSDSSDVGGLVGRNSNGGSIFGCYAAQATVSGDNVGALVGKNYNDSGAAAIVTSCYATNKARDITTNLVGSNYAEMIYVAKFIACISPLVVVIGEGGGDNGGITSTGNYALLIPTDEADKSIEVRTVIPDTDATEAKLGAIMAETRTWTAAGIWGNLTGTVTIAPHINWKYYDGIVAP